MSIAVERVTEGAWVPPWVRHQHLMRYRWARELTRGLRVIDAACGTGYGAPILLESGAVSVDGFDLSAEAVAEARKLYGRSGATFEVGDVTTLPVADASYEIYVSFETLEHVEADEAMLAEAARVLEPGGKLLCSTPNREVMNPGKTIGDGSFNPHHVREYSHTELRDLLERHFDRVEILGQTHFRNAYCRGLTRLGGIHPELGVKAHQVRKLAGIVWENEARHLPRPWADGWQPEVFVAVCQTAR